MGERNDLYGVYSGVGQSCVSVHCSVQTHNVPYGGQSCVSVHCSVQTHNVPNGGQSCVSVH